MSYKIGHAQQIEENYLATLTMQPITLDRCWVALFCFWCFVFFLSAASNLNHYYFLYLLLW